jgi:hypothetical protein
MEQEMTTMEELKCEKESCHKQLRRLCRKIRLLEQMKVTAEAEASILRNKFHEIDRKLAEMDGRLVRLEREKVDKKDEMKMFKSISIADRQMIINALMDLNEGLLQ